MFETLCECHADALNKSTSNNTAQQPSSHNVGLHILHSTCSKDKMAGKKIGG
jgi:hypothetical protein